MTERYCETRHYLHGRYNRALLDYTQYTRILQEPVPIEEFRRRVAKAKQRYAIYSHERTAFEAHVQLHGCRKRFCAIDSTLEPHTAGEE